MKRLIGVAFLGAMLVGCAGSNRNTKTEDTAAQGTYQPPATEQQPSSTGDQNLAPTGPGANNPEQQSPPSSIPPNNP